MGVACLDELRELGMLAKQPGRGGSRENVTEHSLLSGKSTQKILRFASTPFGWDLYVRE